MVYLPMNSLGDEYFTIATIPVADVTASVHISPGSSMSKIMVDYAQMSTTGNVEIKFMNLGPTAETPPGCFTL